MLFAVIIALLVLRHLYPKDYSEYVEKYSKTYGLEPQLVYAIIKCESNFEKDAVSTAGARGLMQMTYDTLLWVASKQKESGFTENSLFNPELNVRYGCALVSMLCTEYDNIETALAAYNAGRGNVNKWLKDPALSKDGKTLLSIPFTETDNYVDKVITTQKIYNLIY